MEIEAGKPLPQMFLWNHFLWERLSSRDLTLGLARSSLRAVGPMGRRQSPDSLLDRSGKYHEKITGFDFGRVAIGLCKFN